MMKLCGCVALSALLLGSCVAVNAAVNAEQQEELEALEGRVHILECRQLRATDLGRLMLAREGEVIDVDLAALGIRTGIKPGWKVEDVECALFPEDVQWASFKVTALSGRSWPLLFWQCSADLCRLGLPRPGETRVTFADVPAGQYLLAVRFTVIDDPRMKTGREWLRFSVLTVSEEGEVEGVPFEKPDEQILRQLSSKV